MAIDARDPQLPPSYEDAVDKDADEILQPMILVLAAHSIHAESTDSAPLYQVNRGIDSLTHATPKVEFQRVQQTIKTSADGEPTIKPRSHHIYDLKYIDGVTGGLGSLPSDSPHYFIQAVSRKTVGNVGIKKSRFRPHWKALPLNVSGKYSKYGLPQFIKDARPLFEILHTHERYEWTDGNGNAIAVEDEGEGQHRLVITASLHRESVDALVALWCCRIWQYSADHKQRVSDGMEGGKPTTSSSASEPLRSLICYSEKEVKASEGNLRSRFSVSGVAIIKASRLCQGAQMVRG